MSRITQPAAVVQTPLLNVAAVGRALRQRAAWLCGAGLLGVAAGVAIGWFSSPVYRVETLLTPVSTARAAGLLSGATGSLAGLAGMVGVNLGGSGTEESAFATLSSRSLAREFITQRGLLPVLFAEEAAAPDPANISQPADSEHSLEDAVDRFLQEVLIVSRDRRTGLVKVAIEWTDPALAADWANGVVQLANDRLRLQAVSDSERAVKYLSSELQRHSSVQVQQSIYRIIEAQMNAAATANASPEFAFKIVDPAFPPDPENYVRPRKLLLTLIMGALFLAVAIIVALWRVRRDLWA